MSAPTQRENLLPANATAFEDAQSQTSARILDAPVNVIRDARKGATAPEKLLPWLGWERSVHHPSDDVDTMRDRIDSSFADHLSYGTPAALESEIALDVGGDVVVKDFWQVAGGSWPDVFVCIPVGPAHPAPADPTAVLASALRRKNVRDWPLVRLEAQETPIGVSVSVGSQVRLTIHSQPVDGKVRTPLTPFIGVGSHLKLRIRSAQL